MAHGHNQMVLRLVLCAAMFCHWSFALGQEEKPQRVPVPEQAKQEAARKIVAELFREDYQKATTGQQKIAVAKKLLEQGIATRGDAAGAYILFTVASDIATQEGDLETALRATLQIVTDYDVDELQTKSALLTAFANRRANTVETARQLLVEAKGLIERYIAADQLDGADAMLDVALLSAKTVKDWDAVLQLALHGKELNEIRAANMAIEPAVRTLTMNPRDPEANLAVGKFHCFVKGDWTTGLSQLALGSDKGLAELATAELKKELDENALGDRWWDVALSQDSTIAKKQVQRHAGYWYQIALPKLTGLARTKVERRLSEAGLPKEAPPRVIINQLDPRKIKPRKVADVTGFDEGSGIMAACFSPDGRLLAAANRKEIKLWDVRANTPLKELVGAREWIFSLAFRHDGAQIAAGCTDGTIRIWNLADGTLKSTIEGPKATVTNVAFSRDNSTLAASENGSRMSLWTPTGKLISNVAGVHCFAFLPNSNEVVVVKDKKVLIPPWQVGEFKASDVEGIGQDPRQSLVSSDAKTLALLYIGGAQRLDLIDLDARKIRNSLTLPNTTHAMAMSPDGSLVLTAGESITLWNARTGQELFAIESRGDVHFSVAFSSNGRHFAFSKAGKVELWELFEPEN